MKTVCAAPILLTFSSFIVLCGLRLVTPIGGPQPTRAIWLQSKSVTVRLGVLDKNGQIGSYKALFVVTGPNGKEYRASVQSPPGDWADVTFPENFDGEYVKPSGIYSSKCIVNGEVVVTDSFRYSNSLDSPAAKPSK